MSDCTITTGRVITAAQGAGDTARTDYSIGRVLFDQKSTSEVSDVFRVDAGTYRVITAYNLSGEPVDEGPDEWMRCESVDIAKISPIVHAMPQGGPCDAMPAVDPRVIREEVIARTNCEAWRLICGHPIAIIAVPGYYRAKLSHPHMVGKVYVELETVVGNIIPAAVVFGGV